MKALVEVLRAHWVLRRSEFARLRRYVQSHSVAPPRQPRVDTEQVVSAVQNACALYFTRSTCLHRSAALVRLLRASGHQAELVLGVRVEPYGGHAWAEVGGVVINDDPAEVARYIPVDRM
jgi:hypothetical protein